MDRIKQRQRHKIALQARKAKYRGKCHTVAKGRYCWVCRLGPEHEAPNNPFWLKGLQ